MQKNYWYTTLYLYYIPHMIAIVLNVCYFIDIILLFKRPFSSKNRNLIYFLWSLIIPISFSLILISNSFYYICEDPNWDIYGI